MELRQLLYAAQIAADKNFSRAAEKLHIAQPSLSQQLSKLEKELGVLLFHRSTNSVELTHAGTVFLEKAKMMLDLSEQIKQEMDDLSQMRTGKLVVGSLPITGAHILPRVLPVFQAAYPQIEVSLIEDTTANLEHLTMNGGTDITLLTLPLAEPALEYRPVIHEEILLAVPPGHRLAKKASAQDGVEIRSLSDEPFIVLKKGQGFRQITLELCQQAGFSPRIVFESTNIETVQSLVASGMGVALVPSMMARSKWSTLVPVYLHFAEPRPYRTLVIVYRKDRYLSKSAQAFIATLAEVMESYPGFTPGLPSRMG